MSYRGELCDRASQLITDLRAKASSNGRQLSEIFLVASINGEIRRWVFANAVIDAMSAIYLCEQEYLKMLNICVNCKYEIDPSDNFRFAYGGQSNDWDDGKTVNGLNYISRIVDDVALTLTDQCPKTNEPEEATA